MGKSTFLGYTVIAILGVSLVLNLTTSKEIADDYKLFVIQYGAPDAVLDNWNQTPPPILPILPCAFIFPRQSL